MDMELVVTYPPPPTGHSHTIYWEVDTMSKHDQCNATIATKQARIAELEAQVTLLTEQLSSKTTNPIAKASKSRQQAEAVYALLTQGPVTMDQLKVINEKYPSDPIYFARTILKVNVVTHKIKGGGTTYTIPVAKVVDATDGQADVVVGEQEAAVDQTEEILSDDPLNTREVNSGVAE